MRVAALFRPLRTSIQRLQQRTVRQFVTKATEEYVLVSKAKNEDVVGSKPKEDEKWPHFFEAAKQSGLLPFINNKELDSYHVRELNRIMFCAKQYGTRNTKSAATICMCGNWKDTTGGGFRTLSQAVFRHVNELLPPSAMSIEQTIDIVDNMIVYVHKLQRESEQNNLEEQQKIKDYYLSIDL